MRVPSIGLMPEERRIVAEGYELAERLLANYREPALGVVPKLKALFASGREMLMQAYRTLG